MSKDLEVIEELRKVYKVTNDPDLYRRGYDIFYSQTEGNVSEIKFSLSSIEKNRALLEILSLGFSELEILDIDFYDMLRENEPIVLPEKFRIFEKLKVLKISGLFILPSNLIPNYKKLNSLQFDRCDSIEEVIRNLINLNSFESLSIINSEKAKLPLNIFDLKGLKKIRISWNQDEEHLASLSKMKNLEILNLYDSNFQKLPESILDLEKLKHLSLSNCSKFQELPFNLGDLGGLEYINIDRTIISEIPESILKLKNLKILNLLGNQKLFSLPDDFGKLISLEHLNLAGTYIFEVPKSIQNLERLETLDLAWCPILRNLPAELVKLKSLEDLNLSNSSIQTLPEDLSELKNLKILNLSRCEDLQSLPGDFVHLNSLEELNLEESPIRELPEGIQKLTALKKLSLRKTRINFPDLSIFGLHELIARETTHYTNYLEYEYSNDYMRKIDISSTHIRKIHKIIETSKLLEKIDSSDNSIQFLPDTIMLLKNLSNLQLRNNRIEYISPEVCRYLINKGIELKYTLENNPLKFPKYDILEQGNQAVLDFLEERDKLADSLPQYRVILAGEGGAGKSSLVDVITGRGFDDSKETTNEIRVITEPFEEENITVHFWDFGGQKIMHSAHKMFFTEDCLYLIVLDSRKEEKPDEWLRFISSKIKNKKAIIVLNKTDMNPNYDLDIKSLRIHYPFIIGLYKVSCQNKEGMDIFKKGLFEMIKKNYLQPPVENWVLVKQEIIALRDSHKLIERIEFDEICKKHSISKDKNLADYFHKIGFIFNALNNQKTVLNTEWLIKGIYPIITNKTVIKNNGKICVTDYPLIFRTDEEQEIYTEYHFLDILDLMKKNDLCFEEAANQYIIPALLPEETPNNITLKEDILNQLKIYIEYKNYLNPSILFQFIARTHKSSPEKLYWRGGIYLEENGNSAIIRSDENSKRIEIIIQGKNKRKYFEEEILPKFREIHKEYILHYEILIDIPISDSAMTLEVNYEELLYLLEISSDKVYHSYKTKRKYSIDKIFENSATAVILPKTEESMEELIQIMNKKLDELSLQMDIKEEKYYETDVKEWLQIPDLQIFEEENRKRIINAESLRDSFNKKKAEDYSMYIAQTCRAIEGELKRKFFINTFKKDNYEEIKTELVTKFSEHLPANSSAQYDKKGDEKSLMLDNMIKAYEFYQLNIRRIPDFNSISFFEPYRDFNLVDDSRFKALLTDIRKEYRNKAAHSDFEIVKYTKEEAEIFREKAKEWFSLWLGGWKK